MHNAMRVSAADVSAVVAISPRCDKSTSPLLSRKDPGQMARGEGSLQVIASSRTVYIEHLPGKE